MTTSNLPVVRSGSRGRPEYSDRVVKKLLLGLSNGMSRAAAAGFAGVHRSYVYDRLARDEAFRAKIEEAEDKATAKYEGTIAAAALGNRGDWRAALAFLERRRPQIWRERVSVDDSGLGPEEALAEAMEADALDDEFYRLAEAALRRRDRDADSVGDPGADGSEPASPGSEDGGSEPS